MCACNKKRSKVNVCEYVSKEERRNASKNNKNGTKNESLRFVRCERAAI